MLFAHLKRILKLDRLRLRGPIGAKDEFHLAAAAQNLRKMAKMIPMPGARTRLIGSGFPLADMPHRLSIVAGSRSSTEYAQCRSISTQITDPKTCHLRPSFDSCPRSGFIHVDLRLVRVWASHFRSGQGIRCGSVAATFYARLDD